MSRCFISYRRDDSADITGRIYDRLVNHFGADNVFKDVDAIPLGVDFRTHIAEAISRCDVLLVVIGRQWLAITNQAGQRRLDDPGDFVRLEIEAALQRGILVIPVLVQETAMPPEEDLPAVLQALAYRNALHVGRDPNFHRDVDRLIRRLDHGLQLSKTPQPVSSQVESPRKPAARFRNSLGMEFALVPRGSFWMGGGDRAPGYQQVEIPYDFYLGIYPVTQEQWQAVMGHNLSYFSRSGRGKKKVASISDADLKRFPAENVSWRDAQQFIATLGANEKDSGWTYSLPREAEWEYACRAGATSPEGCSHHFYFDQPTNELSSRQANFGKALERTSKVGSYRPNRLGIYDLHGNIWEWCEDLYEDGSSRVLRGGSWFNDAGRCRAACRGGLAPGDRDISVGFRLARVPTGR